MEVAAGPRQSARPAAPFREPQSPVRPQHGAFKLEPGAFPHLVRSPPLEAHSVVYLPLGGDDVSKEVLRISIFRSRCRSLCAKGLLDGAR